MESVGTLVQLALLAAIILFLIGLVFLTAIVLIAEIIIQGKKLFIFLHQQHFK